MECQSQCPLRRVCILKHKLVGGVRAPEQSRRAFYTRTTCDRIPDPQQDEARNNLKEGGRHAQGVKTQEEGMHTEGLAWHG